MLRNNDGFDIIINGVDRTFRDVRANAYDAARVLKGNHKGDIVEIRDRSNGNRVVMLEDGRTG